jgi:hypothetical protein
MSVSPYRTRCLTASSKDCWLTRYAIRDNICAGGRHRYQRYLQLPRHPATGHGRGCPFGQPVAAGLKAVEKTGERRLKRSSYRLKGEALLAGAGTVSEAETAIEKGIDVARRQNAKSWELRGAMNLARLRRQQSRPQEAAARSPRSSAGSPKASTPPTSKRPRRCSIH